VSAHAAFGFPLEGAHRATECSACHKELGEEPPAPRSSLRLAGTRFADLQFATKQGCADCHASPHGSQFDAWNARGGCVACHSAEAFVPADRFDHDTDAAFALQGAHEAVPCARCHVRPQGAATAPVVYAPLSGKCETCHGKESR
jgi:Zn finger protein HypA/HybF involved in hydrogenase expression